MQKKFKSYNLNLLVTALESEYFYVLFSITQSDYFLDALC